jgi:hypothetical protein
MNRNKRTMDRRQLLKGAVGAAGVIASAGCDNLTQSQWFPGLLSQAEKLTDLVQRAVTPAKALAREYREADISALFPANGNTDPGTDAYAATAAAGFTDWTLAIAGLVRTPTSWSLGALKDLPARTQITRHDCVEGRSAIGKWTGVPIGDVMRKADPLPAAKYAVFHCADVDDDGVFYYESMAVAISIIRRPSWPMSSTIARWILRMGRRFGYASSGSSATSTPNTSQKSSWWSRLPGSDKEGEDIGKIKATNGTRASSPHYS